MTLAHNAGVSPDNVLTLPTAVYEQIYGDQSKSQVSQVGLCTDWVTVNTNAAAAAAAGVLQTPGTANIVNDSNVRRFPCGHSGTTVRLRLRYPVATPTACSVRVIGFDGSHIRNNGAPIELNPATNVLPRPERLPDSANNLTIVLTPDVPNDVRDTALFAFTKTVSIPIQGNYELIFLVSSAAAATATLEARIV